MAQLLVVDDEPSIVRALKRIFESDGHTVQPATNGPDALALSDGAALAVLDVMMPGMSGIELAEELRARRPGFPILFVTGAPELVDLARFPGAQLIAKPWRVRVLLDAVRAILG